MQVPHQIAKHLRDVHFGGNWTAVNLQNLLADVSWQQATRRVGSFHTIAELVFHMNYFVSVTLQVLEGGPLDTKEALSFNHPEISSQANWERLLNKSWEDAERLASSIEHIPESQLWDDFIDPKYGNYYRCLNGPIEPCHYHLGQIALLKSLLVESSGEA
ncbi:MAG: hypothetical protein R3C18_00505 [Planctomycetaceae bacterium]